MRGLEITLFLISMVLALPLVGVLVPWYNGGAGIDTGATDTRGLNAFNWTSAQSFNPCQDPSSAKCTNSNILDQAGYYFNLATMSLGAIASIIFSAMWIAPALLGIFSVNPVLSGVLLAALGIVLILAWIQIAKGDDWSGRR